MELLFLGTGAGVPSKSRNVSATALKLLDEINQVWLFDCGEATQHQILQTTLKPRKITKIFITHLHGDHIFGLPGFLSSRSFQGGVDPLTVYGPPGINQYIRTCLRTSQSHLSYRLKVIELDPKGGTLTFDQGWRVDYLPLDHGVLSFGYRVTEPDQEGELLIDQLKAYQIPNGPIFGRLKNKEVVTLPDGTTLDGKDFVGPDQTGRVVTILGDTRYHRHAQRLAHEANVLVHECTFGQEDEKLAYNYHHSTSQQAAQIAADAKVDELYLTHISARYVGPLAKELQQEAQAVFANSRIVYDLDEFTIKRKLSKEETS